MDCLAKHDRLRNYKPTTPMLLLLARSMRPMIPQNKTFSVILPLTVLWNLFLVSANPVRLLPVLTGL